jgi:hypothetical protein
MSVGVKVPSEATAKVAGSAVLFHVFVVQTILLVREAVAFGLRPLQKRVKFACPVTVVPIRTEFGIGLHDGPADCGCDCGCGEEKVTVAGVATTWPPTVCVTVME